MAVIRRGDSMLEKWLENKLVKGVEAVGGKCLKFAPIYRRGMPDRIILLPGGRVIWVELKTDTGRTSPTQRKRHRELRALGFKVMVPYGEEGLAEVMAEVHRHAEV